MEKHFWAGLFLLLFLPALALGITKAACTIHEPICHMLAQAQQAALEQDSQQAIALARQADQRWHRFRGVSASVTDHEPIESADSMFAELALYGQLGDTQEFAACCARLRMQIGVILQAARISWWNLF